jgi:hypothetical protein
MNVEIGTEVVKFLSWEYIFFAVNADQNRGRQVLKLTHIEAGTHGDWLRGRAIG